MGSPLEFFEQEIISFEKYDDIRRLDGTSLPGTSQHRDVPLMTSCWGLTGG